MRVLGVDIGEHRIGVAISDGLELTAQGLTRLERRTPQADIAASQALITAHQVERMVVGLPRNMDGSYGPQVHKTERFIRLLEQTCPFPVHAGMSASLPCKPSACCRLPTSVRTSVKR
jgi:putative holliday junction resolvase